MTANYYRGRGRASTPVQPGATLELILSRAPVTMSDFR
jgi:hypothetical protein